MTKRQELIGALVVTCALVGGMFWGAAQISKNQPIPPSFTLPLTAPPVLPDYGPITDPDMHVCTSYVLKHEAKVVITGRGHSSYFGIQVWRIYHADDGTSCNEFVWRTYALNTSSNSGTWATHYFTTQISQYEGADGTFYTYPGGSGTGCNIATVNPGCYYSGSPALLVSFDSPYTYDNLICPTKPCYAVYGFYPGGVQTPGGYSTNPYMWWQSDGVLQACNTAIVGDYDPSSESVYWSGCTGAWDSRDAATWVTDN